MLLMMYNLKNNLAPSYLSELIPPDKKDHISYNLRNSEDIVLPQVRLESYKENAYHFFIECSNYSDLRQQLFNAISCYCSVSLDIILHGSKQLSLKQNHSIFDAVHNFIDKTNQFI